METSIGSPFSLKICPKHGRFSAQRKFPNFVKHAQGLPHAEHKLKLKLNRRRVLCLSAVTNKGVELENWMTDKGVSGLRVDPKDVASAVGSRLGYVARDDISDGRVVVEIPQNIAVTSVDAVGHPVVGPLAQGRSELISLALWMMAEKAMGPQSDWHSFLQNLPDQTLSPILWTNSERETYLKGSPALTECNARLVALKNEWMALQAVVEQEPDKYPAGVFNEDAFLRAFTVVLCYSVYLPSAKCFALLPIISQLKRTGNEQACSVDYDAQSESVVVLTTRPYRAGREIDVYDGRPNHELLLSAGTIEEGNMSDCLEIEVGLVGADRLYSAKREVLELMGYQASEKFPIFEDRMPAQLLAFLRLSRVQDPAELAKVNFDTDSIVSQMNEYEILQLLLGECRDRMSAYPSTIEEDIKSLQSPELTPKERIAMQLVLGEKKIVQGTMESVRTKLAPIRGIPTKSGSLQNPNQDILEVFSTIEDLPQQPKKILDGLLSWARGDEDPEWGGKKKRK